MKLTLEVVEELAQIKADLSRLEKRESTIVEGIKKEMYHRRIDEFAPKGCPYKLVYSQFKRAAVSWKDEWITLAKEIYGKNKYEKVEAKITAASKVPASSLNLELNENY